MTTSTAIQNVQASSLMTRKVQSVMVGDTVQDAFALMNDNAIAALPVIDHEDRCVGILSRTDLNELLFAEDSHLSQLASAEGFPSQWLADAFETLDEKKVSEVMTYDVELLHESDRLPAICRKMARHRIHHLPVVDDAEKLVGILSTLDIVSEIAKHA